MATQDYTRTLTQLVSGSYVPITTGTYYLRAYPFTSNTYTGTHIGSGVWKWANIQDNDYQIWDGSSQVTSFGTIFIGDKTLNLESLNVDGNSEMGGTLTLQGDSLDDSLKVYGQTNFFSSVNHNGSDIAHVGNIQVATISEQDSGKGVSFSHMPKWAGTVSGSSALTNKGFTDSTYYPVSGTTGFQVWTPTNFRGVVGFSGATPPVCGVPPTSNSHLTNMGFVVSEINTRFNNFNIPTSSQQQSNKLAYLIPNSVQVPNKVYYDWRNCVLYGSGSATSTNQKTVLIQANEASQSAVPLQSELTNGKFVVDYLHFKGMGVVNVSSDGNIPSGSFSALSLNNIVIDSINWKFDDSDLGNTAEFYKIVWKNSSFDARTSATLTFYDCHFESCDFSSYLNNQISFVNCTGQVTAKNAVNISGTNKLSVLYNNKFNIGSTTFYDGNDLADDSVIDTEPSKYGQINIAGVDYYFPLFLKLS